MIDMSISIGADIVPTKTNSQLFETGNIRELVGPELISILKKSDYRIFNLEVPLTDKKKELNKHGPNLIANTKTIKGLKELDTSLLTLANNHILDQCTEGLFSTISLLDSYKIGHVGAGNNILDASRPYILEKNGLKVGVFACCEHEFSTATECSAGANPFNPTESFDQVFNLKKDCDYVVVLYHGGKEHYRYPSPDLQKICRKFVDKGANLVVCQHSHCIGCEELYNDSNIIYGQGNFLFDNSDNEYWNSSLLINLTLSKTQFIVDYIPLIKCGNSVRVADETNKKNILMEFRERSNNIQKEDYIHNKYQQFSRDKLDDYMYYLLGENILMRVAHKIFGKNIYKYIYSEKSLLKIFNIIECESHRELFLSGLKEKINA